ncbi:MAG: cation:proton antiporter [Deltaproteobacteria bacterium]|nr:cation:proton antiporter [Deltaproteobacteria bacterium]MCW5804469.1 cation:proton antiporter [Deltaproteobacteria bacterium]
MTAHGFLLPLAVVLCAAGVTTILCQRLHQPVVLGYILAGLLIGPHVPFPIVADPPVVEALSELGVILLMFGLGLEFNLGKLARALPTAGITAILQSTLMIWLGYLAATLFGWTPMESLFAGAIIAISSTTIIAKAFEDEGITGDLRELVVAILIVEDLIAVLLMAILTGVSTGSGVSAEELGVTLARLIGFLVALVAAGLLIVPRLMRFVVHLGRPETTLVAAVGICFGVSLLAEKAGYSVALGAFVAGTLVAESGKAHQIEPLVRPVRDIFAAVFFVAVGMMLDPAEIAAHWVAVLVFVALVVVGKVTSVTFGAFMTGKGIRTSVAAGMSLAQIGEFSFIIAGLGVGLNVVGSQVYPVAVAVSAITTLLTPMLIRRADRVASFVDSALPKPLQTFVALYGSWIDRLRLSRTESRSWMRRFVRTLAVDVAAIAIVLIATSLSIDWLADQLRDALDIRRSTAFLVVVAGAGVLILPFCVSVLRTTHRFGRVLGNIAIPRGESVDLGLQPRRAVEAAVRLVGVLISLSALVAITQPFLPRTPAVIILLLAVATLALLFWRTAIGLQGHVRAAAQAVIEVLSAQRRSEDHPEHDPLEEARRLFPGLGGPMPVEIDAASPAIGRSLAELELRSATGATVLAVVRGGEGLAVPDAHAPLRAGDVLAIAGTPDAIAAAIGLLRSSS